MNLELKCNFVCNIWDVKCNKEAPASSRMNRSHKVLIDLYVCMLCESFCNIWMPAKENTLVWFVCSFFFFHQTWRTKQQDSSLFRDLIFCEKTLEQYGGVPSTAGPRSQSKTNFTIKKKSTCIPEMCAGEPFNPLWSERASVCVCLFCNHGEHSSRKDRGHLE